MSSHIMSRLGIICPCFKPIFKRKKGAYNFQSPDGAKVDKENNGIIAHNRNDGQTERERERTTATSPDRQSNAAEIGGIHNGFLDLDEQKVGGEIKEIHRQEIHLELDGQNGGIETGGIKDENVEEFDRRTTEVAAQVPQAQSRIERLLQAQEEEGDGEIDRHIVGRDRQKEGVEVKEDTVVVESAAGLKVHSSLYGDIPAACTEGGSGRPERVYQDFSGMSEISQVFQEISEGGTEIDAYQLQNILNNCLQQDFEFGGFSDDLCRSMVAMHDSDLSGRLSYHEFEALWSDLLEWKEKYTEHDADNNGYFNKSEFSDILEQIGLSVSEDIMHALTVRYSDREGHIRFDDFVACAVKLKITITTFHDNSGGGDEAEFTTDQFIQLGMYT